MTKILRISMALALTLSSTPAWATLEQEIDLKIQQRTQKTFNGAPSAIPTEYGEIPNGLVLEKYSLEFENDKYVIDVQAENLKQNNQSLKAEGGEPGKMMWKVGWDNMTHLFSNEARSPYVDQGAGVMTLPNAFRNAAGCATSKTTFGACLGGIPYVKFGYDIETANADLKFHPGEDLVVRLGAMRQTKQGTKGTTGAFGFSNAVELAAPIDWTTTEGYLDLQYAKKDYQIGFNYRASEFKNDIPFLYWDNPYRVTDRYSSSSGYSSGDQSKNGGQAMDPNNKAWSAKLEGGVNLPMNSRFSGELGYQRWSAVNDMMFYTTNDALCPGCNTGTAANNVPFQASRTRPADRVDSKMDVMTYMGKMTTRPFHWLRASLSHEAYILQDRGVKYTVPGWAVFDQIWHVDTKTTPTENVRDDKTTLHVDYDVTNWLSGNVGLKHTYKKETREVSKAREYQSDLGFIVRPSKELFVNLAYSLLLRRGNGMDFQNYPTATDGLGRQWFADAPGMRRPDIADKNRNQGRVQVQWTPGEASYGLSARMSEDKYRQGKGDLTGGDPLVYPDLFGTLSDRQVAVGADVSVPLGEKVVLDAYAEYENTKRILRSAQSAAARNYVTGAGGTFVMRQDPALRWTTRLTDNTNVAGVNLTWLTTDKLKTVFGYDVVSTRFNGDPLETGSGVTNYKPLETSRRFQQTLKARGEYKVMKDLTLVGNYMYEKFDATDFAYGSVPVRDAGNNSLFLGASPIRNYYAHTVSGGIKYRF